MKKANRLLLTILLIVTTMNVMSITSLASVKEPTVQEGSIAVYLSRGDEAAAYEYIVTWKNKDYDCISAEVIDYYINLGYMTDYIDEFKNLGYLPSDYGASSPTATNAITSQPAEPEAFTVEAYTPAKTMWATSVVNCRSGASTSYAKVGSLTANEEVSVSGIASTGWYEITKEDGTKVYVSNKYLTDINPNAEMETTEEIVPETIEMVTEEVTAEETAVAEAVEEPFTLEETIKETEPESEEIATEEAAISNEYVVYGIVVLALITGGIILAKKRK